VTNGRGSFVVSDCHQIVTDASRTACVRTYVRLGDEVISFIFGCYGIRYLICSILDGGDMGVDDP
jgi:hypothetical protein